MYLYYIREILNIYVICYHLKLVKNWLNSDQIWVDLSGSDQIWWVTEKYWIVVTREKWVVYGLHIPIRQWHWNSQTAGKSNYQILGPSQTSWMLTHLIIFVLLFCKDWVLFIDLGTHTHTLAMTRMGCVTLANHCTLENLGSFEMISKMYIFNYVHN